MVVEERDMWEVIGLKGKFQKYSIILTFCVGFVYYYPLCSIPFQKIKPVVECRKKVHLVGDSPFQICKEDKYCDLRYERRIVYEKSLMNWTVQFNLLCEQKHKLDYLTNVMFIGQIISNIFVSGLSDKYGRRKMYIIQASSVLVILFVQFAIYNFEIFVLVFFLHNSINGLFLTNLVYINETISQEWYTYLSSVCVLFYAIVGLVQGILYAFISDWRDIQALTILICILLLAVLLQFPETPKFLISKHRYQECVLAFKTISDFNGTTDLSTGIIKEFIDGKDLNRRILLPKDDTEDFKVKPEKTCIFSYLKADAVFRKEFLIMMVSITTARFMFFGLLYNLEKLDSHVYLLSMVVFSSEMFGTAVQSYFSQQYGRNIVLRGFFLLGFVNFTAMVLFFNFFPIKVLCCFIGTICSSSGLTSSYIYMPELFPTEVKSTATSICVAMSNLTLVFTPSIITSKYSLLQFSVYSFISMLLLRYCRETVKSAS